MADIKDWAITAANNSVASPAGAQSGWQGQDVGPWARETMAAVARWNADPGWTNYVYDGIPPSQTTKTVAHQSGNTLRVTISSDWPADTGTKYFPVGRLIRFERTGNAYVYGFVVSASVSTSSLDITIAPIGTASIPTTSYADNGIEFYSAMENYDSSSTAYQMMGPMAFGGYGATTSRDARFNTANLSDFPDGIIWCDTTLEMVQVLKGDAWLDIAPLNESWGDGGGSLTIDARTLAGSDGIPYLNLYAKDGKTSRIRAYERNASDPNDSHARGVIYFNPDGQQVIVEGAREDASGVNGPFARMNVHGAGSSTPGKLEYVYYTYDDSSPPVLQAGVSHNLTPGELDAGTLGTSTREAIISTVSADKTWWSRSSPGPSTGADPASAYLELIRFALPSSIIDKLSNCADGDLSMEVDLQVHAQQGGSGAWESGNEGALLKIYVGPNYGDAGTSITGFPGTSEDLALTPTNIGGAGSAENWRLSGTVSGLNPATDLGVAISVKRTEYSTAHDYRLGDVALADRAGIGGTNPAVGEKSKIRFFYDEYVT